ncbi:MAG: hypothetical protein ACK4YX_03355 [Rhabdaerophilum calidifontis]
MGGNAFASTLLVVAGFTRPEFRIEVAVTALAQARPLPEPAGNQT